eukprot:scaffold69098_cov54-Phaeocystis_antarctica.AAC.2
MRAARRGEGSTVTGRRRLGLTPLDGPQRADRPRHTHTHNIYTYAVRRVCSAGAHPVASPPSPASHRLASASLAVVSDPPNPTCPTPHFLFSPLLVKRRGPGGAHTAPPSGESMDATARAWLVMRTGEEVAATCKSRTA